METRPVNWPVPRGIGDGSFHGERDEEAPSYVLVVYREFTFIRARGIPRSAFLRLIVEKGRGGGGGTKRKYEGLTVVF